MNVRQSPNYAAYMKSIGWQVEKIGKWNAFIRKFPILGSFIKIQKITPPIPFEKIELLRKKYRAYTVKIEAGFCHCDPPAGGEAIPKGTATATSWLRDDMINLKKYNYQLDKNPFIPTKTIQIDLRKTEEEMFKSFDEAKRRAVRRAEKNGVSVKVSEDIESFISIKSKYFWPLGILIKKDIFSLWKNFYPGNARLLLAYKKDSVIGGIILLFYDQISYYWLAGATNKGKKLFAPTILVWEVLKLSKKLGCNLFDFEGIYDERFPKTTASWKGFTRFKQGFGGEEIVYSVSYIK
ncbi:MAG: Methicillin resistance protein [Candidatus Gottesmanbacteria bacterium GW2011_GWA2_41_12]|uniref:Methicillin resistance protein n=2 Tax=Candidatus Gottesmaniibacteriota TaxID=1752720 RepID=A0A0G0UM79_9BACT|nr:MAG: Methicillin resistance protein [Candidatus Gottesmanbacteria bacterium GW2011_GWC2_39_8]KKR88621.1 MAG: Methicillin resistance protein [Candidatus Gottesmanbacteria bacterium GW2011_GWA2_41_12]